MLQSLIGRMASRPMRNIETFPSKQMYLYLSLVERKVAEIYHNRVKMTYFHRFLLSIESVLVKEENQKLKRHIALKRVSTPGTPN